MLVFGFILFKRRSTFRQFRAQSLTVLTAGVAILVAGAVWYAMFRQHFLKYAHLGAAVGMFAVVGFVILLNALHRRGQRKSWLPYAGIAGAMALSGVSVWAVDQFGGGWRHKVLWLELLELTAFAVFWVAQTFEHWDGGAPTGAERQI